MKFNVFFRISGPTRSVEAPNTTNPMEADSIGELLKGLSDNIPEKIAGGLAELTGIRIEEVADGESGK